MVESEHIGWARSDWTVIEIEAGTAVNYLRHAGNAPVWRMQLINPKYFQLFHRVIPSLFQPENRIETIFCLLVGDADVSLAAE